jgi:hypothetical protein
VSSRIHRDLYRHRPWAGNSPAWWYVALLATGTGVLALAVARRRLRPLLILGAFCLALCRTGRASVDRAALGPRGGGGNRGGHETLMAPAPATLPVNIPGRMSCQPDTRQKRTPVAAPRLAMPRAMVIAHARHAPVARDHQLAGDGDGEPAAQTTTQPPHPSR